MVYEYEKTQKKQLSTNFRLEEFRCKCGRSDCRVTLLDDALVKVLQQLRDHFGRSVNVNSGYRCKAHNEYVGGDPGSHHMKGMAADIRVEGILPEEVAKYAESMGVKRIGLYDNFVHLGSGTGKRFWLGHEGTLVDTFGGETLYITAQLPVLKRGGKSDTVGALQALLRGKGHTLEQDGSFGPATEAAVKAYQAANGLAADGSVGPATWGKLLGVET